MKITSASIEYGRVINLGEFNSLRATCNLGVEFEHGDDVDALLEDLWQRARESVRAQVVRVMERPRHQRAMDPAGDGPDESSEALQADQTPSPRSAPAAGAYAPPA